MTGTTPGSRLTRWLFNPYTFIAGFRALLIGLVIILLSAFIGSLGRTHFDGVIDVHTGMPAPLWYFFAESLLAWVSVTIPLFFFGLIISHCPFRIVDVLGTQALARTPYLITSVVMLPEANRRFGEYMVSRFTQSAATPAVSYTDTAIFAFAIIIAITMTVWTVALMYRAYAVSCNVKGVPAIVTFIVSLAGAEVLCKAAISLLLM